MIDLGRRLPIFRPADADYFFSIDYFRCRQLLLMPQITLIRLFAPLTLMPDYAGCRLPGPFS